jgi:hypothetical protein
VKIVLVCGGRDYGEEYAADGAFVKRRDLAEAERAAAFAAFERVRLERGIALVVHGACGGERLRGADGLAHAWALQRGLPVLAVPARWDLHGKRAGPIRNREMLDFHGLRPDVVVALPGGRGTRDMCHAAEQAGTPVWRPPTPEGE